MDFPAYNRTEMRSDAARLYREMMRKNSTIAEYAGKPLRELRRDFYELALFNSITHHITREIDDQQEANEAISIVYANETKQGNRQPVFGDEALMEGLERMLGTIKQLLPHAKTKQSIARMDDIIGKEEL